MAEFYNKRRGKCVLLDERKGFMLIAAIERNEYIIALSPVKPDGSWTWGSYYKDLFTAVAEYKDKTKFE